MFFNPFFCFGYLAQHIVSFSFFARLIYSLNIKPTGKGSHLFSDIFTFFSRMHEHEYMYNMVARVIFEKL